MSNGYFKINKGIVLAAQTSDPSPAENGSIYYNSTSEKFRKYENGAWSDLSSDPDLATHEADTSTHGITSKIVGEFDAAILTNKEFGESTTFFINEVDATKKIRLDTQNISSGGIRSIIMPDANVDLTTVGDNETKIDNHLLDVANPHSVDAADVSLGNVDNTSDATKDAATATLTNKTLTSPVINTGISGTAVLDEDDMTSDSNTQIATQQSIKAYVDANAGGGSGDKNYIDSDDSDFENGVSNWSTFNDGASFVDGTGAPSVNLVIATTTLAANVLNGSQSLLIQSLTSTLGMGAKTTTLDIDRADRGRTLWASLEFDTSFAGAYASGDLRVRAYDITNSAELYIGPEEDVLIPDSKGKLYFPIYTETTTASIRFIIGVNQINASGYTIVVDDVKISPVSTVPGFQGGDPVDYTPTGSWTANTNYSGKWTRVGGFAEYSVRVNVTGIPTNTGLIVNLDPNHLIDTSEIAGFTGDFEVLGQATIRDSGSAIYMCEVFYFSDTSIAVSVGVSNGNYTNVSGLSNTIPHTWASGDHVDLIFRVPVVGWSSGAQVTANELALQTVSASYNGNTATSIPQNTTVVVDFPTKRYDDFSTVTTGSGWNFVAPRKMKTQITASMLFDSVAYAVGDFAQVSIFVNGTDVSRISRPIIESTTTHNLLVKGNDSILLEKGDIVDIRVTTSRVGGITVFSGGGNFNFCTIEEIPDFTTFGVVKGSLEVVSATSSVKTPTATSTFMQMTGNSLTLSAGTFILCPSLVSLEATAVTGVMVAWFGANGSDTGSAPVHINTLAGLTVLSATHNQYAGACSLLDGINSSFTRINTGEVIVKLTKPATLYLVPYAVVASPGSLNVTAYPTARRIE